MVAREDNRQEMAPRKGQLAIFVPDRMHLLESRHTLFNFKQKFHPHWESRYIVINSTLALPKIALAVLRIPHYTGGGSRSLFSHFVFQDGIQPGIPPAVLHPLVLAQMSFLSHPHLFQHAAGRTILFNA